MNANEYQALAMKTSGMTNFEDRLAGAVMGLAGETGEIADLAKKLFFHDHPLDQKMLDKFRDEAGDVLWYVALLCTAFGWSLEDVMSRNIDKLKKCYPAGFSSEASINREEYRAS